MILRDRCCTVLGPLLFLIYINDITSTVSSTISLFADDAYNYRSIRNIDDYKILQEDLPKLIQWEQSWSMEFHPDKCKVLRITNKRKTIKYRYLLHNVILKEVSNAKYLGVTMNTRLAWKKHVHEICGKANQTRQFLQRNLVACKPETKLQCCKTLIRPIVEYSSSVWDPVGNNQLMKQIELVQGKASRWITNNWNCDVSSGQIAKELQLQSLSERRELARLKFLHSIYWGQKFLPKCIIPERTRYTDIRFKPIYGQVSCYNNSFIPYTVKQWNLLQREV